MSCCAAEKDRSQPPGDIQRLSRRELEVLEHVARGLTNKEIARSLGVRESTVRGYMERILRVLGVPNRTAAAARWNQARSERP